MRSTRQHDFSVAIYTETGITYRLTDINSSRKPDISLCTIASCAERRSIIVHPNPRHRLPCNAESCTGQHTVCRSLVFLPLFISREKKGHGGRACRLALSGRIGSSLDIPSIQLSRITRGFYLSPHYYWQEKRHFLNQNEKIFFFSLAGGLCPSLLLAKKSAFLQPKQKNNFIFLRFAVFGVLTSCSCFSLPYFPHPPA